MLALVFSNGLVVCGAKQKANYMLSATTNSNWKNGVSKGWGTAFFIKNADQEKTDFLIGKKVILADGSVRAVTSNQISRNNLIVYLNRESLHGYLDGYPNSATAFPLKV